MGQGGEATYSGCQRQRSWSAIKSPNFCRLIVSPSQDKLSIPRKFVKKFGIQLGNVATLTTPNGCICHVKLEKTDGKYCFTDGWHEFVEHQSIGVDYLLIFTYLGNSNLRVNIYDICNAEINYQCNTPEGPSRGHRVPVKEEVGDDYGVEILDSPPPCQTPKSWGNKNGYSVYEAKWNGAKGGKQHIAMNLDRASVPCVYQECGCREPIKEEVGDVYGVEILDSPPPCQTPKSWENKKGYSVCEAKGNSAKGGKQHIAMNLDRASVPCVQCLYRVCGCREPIKEEVGDDYGIEILNSPPPCQTPKSWENKKGYSVYEAKGNSAKGDKQHIAMNLHRASVPCVQCLYRECGCPEPIKEEVEDDYGVEILDSPPPFETPKSCETKEANNVYEKKAKVSRAGISNSQSSVSCEANGDKKQSGLITPEAQQNQSTKKRKLDERDDSAQKVSRLHTPGAETSLRRSRAVTPREIVEVFNASRKFQSKNPFCRVFLRHSYIHKANNLHMPSSFAKKYLGGVSKFLTLAVSGGGEWRIWCAWRNGSANLSRGWPQFVLGNRLEEGDVCVFELIKTVNIVLKVTIFRVAQDAEPAPEERKEKKRCRMQNSVDRPTKL